MLRYSTRSVIFDLWHESLLCSPKWSSGDNCLLMQVYLLQKVVPPASIVLISSLPQKVVIAVPEVVVALLVVSQSTMFVASQLKGLTALMLYRAIPRSSASHGYAAAQ